MSAKGLGLAADVLSAMQEARIELIGMGASSEGDQQDVLLGQMFNKANEAIKWDFSRITLGKFPESNQKIRVAK
jgi:hypothetical protein